MRPPGGYRTESSVTSPCKEPSSQFMVLLVFQIIPCGTSPAPPTSSSTLTRATYSAVDSTICLADFTCLCCSGATRSHELSTARSLLAAAHVLITPATPAAPDGAPACP